MPPGAKPRGPLHRRTWRPDLAYVVGLLTTDGNLSPTGRHIILVSRDQDLINTYATILQLSNRIVRHPGGFNGSLAFHISFGDRLFYQWLTSIGIHPRKTLTIGALQIPDEFFPDFLRGHLDGDGSVTSYVDRYNTKVSPSYVYQRLYVRFLSASRIHVEWLQATIRNLHGEEGSINVTQRPSRRPLFSLKFAKKESITLLRWMYYSSDVPCLARKRNIAEPFLRGDLKSFRHPVEG